MLNALGFITLFLGILGMIVGLISLVIHGGRTGRFIPSAYEAGKKVIAFTAPFEVQIRTSEGQSQEVTKTKYAAYKFVTSTKCLFIPNMSSAWVSFTLAPRTFISGSIEFQSGKARVEGRIPIGILIFYFSFLGVFRPA
jgi:hypothetical protein